MYCCFHYIAPPIKVNHPSPNCHFSGRLRLPMDNGKCIMDNDCVAIGDDSKSFPKEIPQLSIIHYPFGYLPNKRGLASVCRQNRKSPLLLAAGFSIKNLGKKRGRVGSTVERAVHGFRNLSAIKIQFVFEWCLTKLKTKIDKTVNITPLADKL